MKLDINKLYHYIFGDWADIEKHIKQDLPTLIKNNKIKEKKEEIASFFSVLKNDLRPVLRTIKNSHLEKILYGNDTDELYSKYILPDEKTIDTEFDAFENYHSLLKDEKSNVDKSSRIMFHEFFKIAKLIGDKIEKNNDQNNSAAFKHSYKLLIIFGSDEKNYFSPIEKYLEKFNFYNVSSTPLHDALINQLPKIENEKIQLKGWRIFIQKFGIKAMQLFNIAPLIERELQGKVPEYLNEAVDAAKKCRYKNAKEYTALADLFIEYNLDEQTFNKSLEIEKKIKKKDILPNVSINGSDICTQYAGYHIVKLPSADPRSYILGHITNCCQSMGRRSEQCVIDGITLENNGFYVLLKNKVVLSKNNEIYQEPLPIVDGKINNTFYDIVGQGYAWLSKQGNLVFDSWENLTPDRDDSIIVPLLEKFSQNVCDEKNSSIIRVTIGTGGKTPEILSDRLLTYAEKMKEGTQYPDSTSQVIIYCNDERRKTFITELSSIVGKWPVIVDEKNIVNVNTLEIVNWSTESVYSQHQLNLVKESQTESNIKLILSFIPKLFNFPWTLLNKLFNRKIRHEHLAEMLSQNNLTVVENIKKSHDIKESYSYFLSMFTIIESGYAIDDNIRTKLFNSMSKKSLTTDIIKVLTILKKEGHHPYDMKNNAACKAYSIRFKNYFLILKSYLSIYFELSNLNAIRDSILTIDDLDEEKIKLLSDNFMVLTKAGINYQSDIFSVVTKFCLGTLSRKITNVSNNKMSFSTGIANAVVLLQDEDIALVYDKHILSVITKSLDPLKMAATIIKSLSLLTKHRFDYNYEVRNAIIDNLIERESAILIIDEILKAFTKLRDMNIEIDLTIIANFMQKIVSISEIKEKLETLLQPNKNIVSKLNEHKQDSLPLSQSVNTQNIEMSVKSNVAIQSSPLSAVGLYTKFTNLTNLGLQNLELQKELSPLQKAGKDCSKSGPS